MKKILLVMALISFGYIHAEAQSKKSTYAKNYPICLSGNKYKVCPAANSKAGRSVKVNNPSASLRMMDTTVHMGYSTARPFSSMSVLSNRRNPRIRVTIDDPQAPYEGKESMINDGVQKNKQRNINYLDNSVELPPNDGGVSDR